MSVRLDTHHRVVRILALLALAAVCSGIAFQVCFGTYIWILLVNVGLVLAAFSVFFAYHDQSNREIPDMSNARLLCTDSSIESKSEYGLATGIQREAATLLRHGRLEDALRLFRMAAEIAPENWRVSLNIGTTLAQLGRYVEALEALDLAISLQPATAAAWNNKGTVLMRLGQLDEAESAFRRALAAEPEYLLARYNLAAADARLGRPEESLAALSELRLREPSLLRFVKEDSDFDSLKANPQFAALVWADSVPTTAGE